MKKLLLVLVLFPSLLIGQKTLGSMNIFFEAIDYAHLGYDFSITGEKLVGSHVGNGMCYELIYAVQDSVKLKEDSVAKAQGYGNAELGYKFVFNKVRGKNSARLLQLNEDRDMIGFVIYYSLKDKDYGHVLIIDQESATGVGFLVTDQNSHGKRLKNEYVDREYIKSLVSLMQKCDNFTILEPVMKLTNKIN